VGFLAVRRELMKRLCSRRPAPSLAVAPRLEFDEANVAAQVGFSVALGEHLVHGSE